MSNLQKIVVLCFFGTLLVGGTLFIAPLFLSFSTNAAPEPIKQIDPPSLDIEAGEFGGAEEPSELPVVKDGKVIESFKDCVADGNPIMESHPRRCRAEGMLYTETVSAPPASDDTVVACTRDAKVCSDGSSVGRTGPNCEFAACPNEIVPNDPGEAIVACTMDAKICPDGSSVGRTGPNCEFAACPVEE